MCFVTLKTTSQISVCFSRKCRFRGDKNLGILKKHQLLHSLVMQAKVDFPREIC
jgi:hypothetical protein